MPTPAKTVTRRPKLKQEKQSRPISKDAVAVRHAQMCEMLGVGATKGHELIRTGAVESVLIGKTRLVSLRSIHALIHGKGA